MFRIINYILKNENIKENRIILLLNYDIIYIITCYITDIKIIFL